MKKFLCMTMLMLAALTASAMAQTKAASPPEQDIGYQQAATLSPDGMTVYAIHSQLNIVDWQMPVMVAQEAVTASAQVVGAVTVLLEQLTKGVPATLTLKDGKGTITLGHDDDGDPHPGEAPEEELTDEEKRIRRMAEEYDQLTERYGKLTDFLTTDKFGTLPENTQTLLRRQHQAMHDYREALRQRIRIDADAANLKVEINDPDDE